MPVLHLPESVLGDLRDLKQLLVGMNEKLDVQARAAMQQSDTLARIELAVDTQGEAIARLESSQTEQTAILKDILAAVGTTNATTFVIEIASDQEIKMNKKHTAGVDIAILINGTGIATISGITDTAGNPVSAPAGLTVPAWSSTNPAALQVVPSADGMSAALTGLAAATGVVLTASATFVDSNGANQTVTGDGDPIDIAAAPPGAAAKFVITESAS